MLLLLLLMLMLLLLLKLTMLMLLLLLLKMMMMMAETPPFLQIRTKLSNRPTKLAQVRLEQSSSPLNIIGYRAR